MLNLIAIVCVVEAPSLGNTEPVLHLLSDKGMRTNTRVKARAAFKSLGKKLKQLRPKAKYILVGKPSEDEFLVEGLQVATGR